MALDLRCSSVPSHLTREGLPVAETGVGTSGVVEVYEKLKSNRKAHFSARLLSEEWISRICRVPGRSAQVLHLCVRSPQESVRSLESRKLRKLRKLSEVVLTDQQRE